MPMAQAAPEHAPGGNKDGKADEKRHRDTSAIRPLVGRVGEPAQQNHAGVRGVPGPGPVGNKGRRTDTKAHVVRRLLASPHGLLDGEIARIAKCSRDYVRAVRSRDASETYEVCRNRHTGNPHKRDERHDSARRSPTRVRRSAEGLDRHHPAGPAPAVPHHPSRARRISGDTSP